MELLRFIFGFPREALQGATSVSARFLGVPDNLWVLMALVVALGFVAWLSVRTYLREGQRRLRLQLVLAGIRLTAFALLLLIFLQPAAVLEYRRPVSTAVLVLVDDSLSMSWADRGGQKRTKRVDVVKDALARQGGALEKLAREHPLAIYRFSPGGAAAGAYVELLADIDDTAPAGAAPRRPAGGQSLALRELAAAAGRLKAEGYETNINRALREALDRAAGRRLAAVVLVSDGQNTTAATEERTAATRTMLGERGVPLYAVAVGDPTPPRNIVVAQLQGPAEVRKGTSISFSAFLTHRGYGGTEVEVELLRQPVGGGSEWDDTKVVAKATLGGSERADDAGKLQEVTLVTQAPEVGEYVYKARVKPLGDEMITTDNEAKARSRVSEAKVNVLLIGGHGGPEFQFLRNYLIKHPEHYQVSTWQQSAEKEFNQESSSKEMSLASLPARKEDLYRYDLIVFYDARQAADLDLSFLEMMKEFVDEHHGGVCYIAGNRNTDQTMMPGGPFEPLSRLLPVTLARPTGGPSAQMKSERAASPIEITVEGLTHPMMQLAVSGEDNRKAWASLPGVFRPHKVDRVKPLASTLLTARPPGEAHAQPYVAIQTYGKGRVMYLGSDHTWRWRVHDDTNTYQRFWGRVIDFLSAGRLEKKRVLITTGGDVFDLRSEIHVRLEAYTRNYAPLEGKKFTVSMAPSEGGDGNSYVLQATGKPGIYEGTIQPRRVGTFDIAPQGDQNDQKDWEAGEVAVKQIEVRLPEEEFRRPEANYQALRELLAKAERFLTVRDFQTLGERIRPSEEYVVDQRDFSWLNSPRNGAVFLGLLAVLLLTEWVVRKLNQMM